MTKVLMVLTSHAKLGDTGRRTGLWLEELATPYYALLDGDADITLASVKGGDVPLDPQSIEGDKPQSVKRFLADQKAAAFLKATAPVDQLDAADFDAIFLPGGHGTMWDLPASTALATAIGKAFDDGRFVAAVCHGPAGLVAARRADGNPVVRGRRVSSFTNAEEEAAGLSQVVPFLLETRLRELGAHVEKAPDFQPFAVRDGNLITGQNPASAEKVAELLVQALSERAPGSASDNPPVIAAPAGTKPALFTLRLTAKDAEPFKAHLLKVIPVTRVASGCRYSHSYQGTKAPNEFLLVQGWDSIEQQQGYIAWRAERGDLAEFRSFLSDDPLVDSFTLFDE